MSKRKIGSTAFCAAVLAAVLAGCSLFSGKGGETSAVPAGFSQSAVSSALPQSSAVSPSGSEASVPEASSQSTNQPDSSQPGQVLEITTDDEAFNRKFAENPMDKKYIAESNQAVSSLDMIKISDKYRDIWKAEVDYAYAELEKKMMADSSDKPEKYRTEQEQWRSGQKEELQKIADEAQAAGGSMARVDAASKVMDYYRSRAAQIYRELYGYDKNYTYAYTEKK